MRNAEERKVAWLASAAHFLTHGYMTLLPAVLVVLTGIEGLTFFEIGIIGTVGYFLYGAGSIPAGILTDRYGAKRMLTLGVLGMAVTSILVGIAPVGWFFAVAYAVFGLSASIYHPSGLPLIAKHIEKKGKALGLHGIMGNLGLTVSPLFAALMIMIFISWRSAYIVFGLIGLGFAFFMMKIRIENEPELSFSWFTTRGQGSTCDLADKNKNDSAEGIQASRMSSPDPLKLRGLVLLGISGGIIPCPAAIAILLASVSTGNIGKGLGLVIVFSMGLAIALVAIGLVIINSVRLGHEFINTEKFAPAAAFLSAVVITLAGAVTLYSSLRHLTG